MLYNIIEFITTQPIFKIGIPSHCNCITVQHAWFTTPKPIRGIMKLNSYSRITIFVAILFFLYPVISFAQTVSVKKDNVNVRSGPGTEFPVAMELFKGYPLKVIKKKGDWLQVSDFENDKGWIFSSLVSPGSTVIVNGKKSVNMRSKPNTKATVIASVDRGVVLTKISTQAKWIKVKHSQGTVGWIYAPLLWP